MSRNSISALIVALSLVACTSEGRATAIIVDHNCVDLSVIPDEYPASAASTRVLMRHASVGQSIDWGLDCLAGDHPTNPACSPVQDDKYDRGNWILELRGGNWRDKVDDLVAEATSRTNDFDVFMMKFCYIDALGDRHPDWEYYRNRMEQLEVEHPHKMFVWWTIPLTRDGQPGTDLFNAQMRFYCAANDKILFDIADIECYEPNGVKLTSSAGNDIISQEYTKEIHAGHLNPDGRVRVASAFWHLMARITGWDPGLVDTRDDVATGRTGRLFVDAAAGNDSNNGLTPETALATIQEAVDQARDGDTVAVSPGLYAQDINYLGKNITVSSIDPMSSDIVGRTTIDGMVYFRGTEDPNCVLAGFTIDGYIIGSDPQADPEGRNHTRATIRHCVFEGTLTGCGGLIQACDGTISHCVIANIGYLCRRAWPVPAIRGCHGRIVNCTMIDMRDGIEVLPGGTLTIENCIMYHSPPIIVPTGATVNVRHCDIESGRDVIFGDGAVNWGPGNIDTPPCVARMGDWQSRGDYHLKSQAGRWDPNHASWVKDNVMSPCIDAGDPNGDWTGELWPHGKRVNMGAYGGTPQASMSLSAFGSTADLSHDEAVNAKDLLVLTEAWLTEGGLLAEDMNRDGEVDFRDFVTLAGEWRTDSLSPQEPFELLLAHNASWSQGYRGYDPNLPGYHIVGDIASVTLRATTDTSPDKLILAIRTSPGMPAMLENFTLVSPHVKLSGEPLNDPVGLTYFRRIDCSEGWEAVPEMETDMYLRFETAGGTVRVTFLPMAIELLRAQCEISWIDWYR